MTAPQWLFHYHEILSNKKAINKEICDFSVEVVKTALEVIADKLDFVAAVAATKPEVGKQILEHKELTRARKQIDENKFKEDYQELKKVIPAKFIVALPGKLDGILPKISRYDFERQYGIFEEGDKR